MQLSFWSSSALPQAGQVSGPCLFTLSLEIRFLPDYYPDFLILSIVYPQVQTIFHLMLSNLSNVNKLDFGESISREVTGPYLFILSLNLQSNKKTTQKLVNDMPLESQKRS